MSNPVLSLLVALTAGAASWLLLRALIPQLKQRLLDQPNERSAHTTPTPRGGGVAFVLVTLLFSSLLLLAGPTPALWIPWICAPLALVGLLDDRLNLPALLRYSIQILTAIALLLPAALLGHLLGLISGSFCLVLLESAALLLVLLALRKFGMDAAADVGDKSVFAYLDGQLPTGTP